MKLAQEIIDGFGEKDEIVELNENLKQVKSYQKRFNCKHCGIRTSSRQMICKVCI